jgi:flagellar biosynthesis protein FlhF
MDVKTFRAKNMQEALAMVRSALGPQAAVLQTREVRAGGLLRRLTGERQIEVTASADVNVPSRFTAQPAPGQPAPGQQVPVQQVPVQQVPVQQVPVQPEPVQPEPVYAPPLASRLVREPVANDRVISEPVISDPVINDPVINDNAPQLFDYEQTAAPGAPPTPGPARESDQAEHLRNQLSSLQSMVENLYQTQSFTHDKAAEEFFDLYTTLIDVDISENSARDLVDRLPRGTDTTNHTGRRAASRQLCQAIEDQINVSGPIVARPGERRIVALVGPTGVGKTTTIAKLAANYRLREKCKVGLITVDTYRIAAVEQLRTYADIIDLPMEVVSTPKEMRSAIDKFSDMELILIDTAGRSPRDEVKIHELKSFLMDAQVDEVHLVLSTVASTRSLRETAERFRVVGTTSLLLTKVDEATVFGPVFELLRSTGLPVSYVTNGQNVPDDIEAARSRRLAKMILPVEGDDD